MNDISTIPSTRRGSYANFARLLLFALLLLLSLSVFFSPSAQANDGKEQQHHKHTQSLTLDNFTTEFSASKQIYNSDLKIESGELIDDDVVVYNGDVKIEEDGAIRGSLSIYSGNVEIEEGGLVEGDILVYSGDIEIAGMVNGRVAAASGDVELKNSAHVRGDISILNGELDQDRGARVGGSLIEGFGVNSQRSDEIERSEEIVGFDDSSNSIWQGFFGFLIRLVLTTFVAIATIVLVGLLAYVKPNIVYSVQETIQAKLAMSLITGLLTNVILIVLIALLSLTVCLIPIALIPVLLFVGLNLVGWAALSAIVGERAIQIIRFRMNAIEHFTTWPAMKVIVGAVILTIPLALFWMFGSSLWVIGGCLQFILLIGTVILASIGVGAVVTPWINRVGDDGLGGYMLKKRD